MRLIEVRRIVQHIPADRVAEAKRALAATIIEKGHGVTVAGTFLRNGLASAVEHDVERDTYYEWELKD